MGALINPFDDTNTIKKIKHKQHKIAKLKQQALLAFKNNLQSQLSNALSSNVQPKYQPKTVAFIGQISSGKTALLKKLFKYDAQVGISTINVKIVYSTDSISVYDIPGFYDGKFNSSTNSFFKKCPIDQVYVLYDRIVKDLVMSVKAIKVKVYYVRTKCDEKIDLSEQIQKDICDLKQLGIQNPIIFTSSSKGGFDNERLKEQILMEKSINLQDQIMMAN